MSGCESDSAQVMSRAFPLPESDDGPGDDQSGGASRPVLAESLRVLRLERPAQPVDAAGIFPAKLNRVGRMGACRNAH